MGGGASTEMTAEQQGQIAGQCISELLNLSAVYAVEQGQIADTWKRDELAIPVPMRGKFDAAGAAVAKIPMVGSGLKKQVDGAVTKIQEAFIDCAVTVCKDPGTLKAYQSAIGTMAFTGTGEGINPIEMCRQGGDAFADYMITTAAGKLIELMTPVINEILKTHTLTKVWDGANKIYGTMASKVPALKPIELELADYCTEQILGSLEMMIRSKERLVKKDPEAEGSGATDTIKMVYKGGLVAKENPRLILVAKGDPKAIIFENASGLAGDTSEPVKMTLKNAQGHALTLKHKPRTWKHWSYIELEIAKGNPESTVSLSRKGKFLVADGRVLDVAMWRLTVGAMVNLVSDTRGEAQTFSAGGGRDFDINEDGTISPSMGRNIKEFVLGFQFQPTVVTVGTMVTTTTTA